ncbi:hypothetical protein [Cellvibrio sp. QJXJ]|uniref:hypothetical protein n=1 Tax=Cellvibrio sp. QJXJ TaxID=2964606 RepID=UPI0021C36563|nr:hypothetical protein [Cellvibrio sp. QJXJ]UUA73116.1 hypothetical protein NNX04_01385 [Cellvibrio sp. QJXJ]
MNKPIESIIDFYREFGEKSNFDSISDISFTTKITTNLINKIISLNALIRGQCDQDIIEVIHVGGKSYQANNEAGLNNHLDEQCTFNFDSVSIKGTNNIHYSVDKFLRFNKTKKPDFFYIAEIDYATFDNKENHYIKAYDATIDLIETLINADSGVCDFSSYNDKTKTHRIVLLGEKKFEFETTYSKKDLDFDSEKIKAFIKDISIDSDTVTTHKKEKNQILKKSICDLLKHVNKDSEKFAYILNHIEELQRDYNNGLDLYLNEFTFSKFISDLSDKKISYIEKINKVISDIGLKLLFLPLIGIATKLSSSDANSTFAFTLYAGLMMLLIIYTIDSLAQISQEMKNAFHHKRYKKSILTSGNIEQELIDAWSQLNTRIKFIYATLFSLYIGLLLFVIKNLNPDGFLGAYEAENLNQFIQLPFQLEPVFNFLIFCSLLGAAWFSISRLLCGIWQLIFGRTK